jgi:uncharacterized protein with PIN domain
MAKVRFLVDVHVHIAITEGLRRRGVEVMTCQEAGLGTMSDEEILSFAKHNNWVVFTQDGDFLKICSEEKYDHNGLVYSHKRNSISRIIQGLLLVFEVLERDEMMRHIEFV